MTERFNRTLGDMLAKYASSDQSNWDSILPFVTYAYNTATQSTTGFSPFFLLYGREPSSTMDTILPYRPDPSEMTTVSRAAAHAEECRKLARAFTSHDQTRQKHRHDASTTHMSFAPNSLVWLWIPSTPPGLSHKLSSRYHGPYRVVRQTSPVNYLVEPLDASPDKRRRGQEIVHISRLKPYHDPSVYTCP